MKQDFAPEQKTGKSIDLLKDLVIIPEVANLITEFTSEGDLTILDIGPGDGTAVDRLTEALSHRNRNVSHMLLAEVDYPSGSELLKLFGSKTRSKQSTFYMDPRLGAIFGLSIENFEDRLDVVTAQMAFHDIADPALRGLYLAKSFMGLKSSGVMLITDFHPAYYEYLQDQEPTKFQIYPRGMGAYRFDSGGEKLITIFKREELVAQALTMGFRPIRSKIHDLSPAAALKPRYSYLLENGIPMIYTLVLTRDEQRFLAYSEGTIKDSWREGPFTVIKFHDDSERQVPMQEDMDLKPGDSIIIHQVTDPTDTTKKKVISNVWTHKIGSMGRLRYFRSVAWHLSQ